MHLKFVGIKASFDFSVANGKQIMENLLFHSVIPILFAVIIKLM